jgi:arginine/ornithine transport system permease protein
MFDFSIIFNEWPTYLEGLKNTIWLVAVALLAGLSIAIPVGIIRSSSNAVLRSSAWAYIYFFRGTPLLVQLFIIYYGAGQWQWLQHSWAWKWFQEAWFCSLLAFALNTGAYTAEIVRGAIQMIPKGELEAAAAFGMSYWQMLRHIILPSALRRALPAYSNEVILMLHGSSVAGVITVVDLTGAARIVNARYYMPFEAFITAGLLYLMLSLVLVWGFRHLERRWYAHLRPRIG